MMRITQTNVDAASDNAWRGFVSRLRTHLASRLPGFADLPPSEQDQRIETWTGAARGHGFMNERSLAFWCHVAGRLPEDWTEAAGVAAVLADQGPSEPERLHRLKARLEGTEWAG